MREGVWKCGRRRGGGQRRRGKEGVLTLGGLPAIVLSGSRGGCRDDWHERRAMFEFRRWTGRWRDAVRLGLAPELRLLGLNHSDRLLCWWWKGIGWRPDGAHGQVGNYFLGLAADALALVMSFAVLPCPLLSAWRAGAPGDWPVPANRRGLWGPQVHVRQV